MNGLIKKTLEGLLISSLTLSALGSIAIPATAYSQESLNQVLTNNPKADPKYGKPRFSDKMEVYESGWVKGDIFFKRGFTKEGNFYFPLNENSLARLGDLFCETAFKNSLISGELRYSGFNESTKSAIMSVDFYDGRGQQTKEQHIIEEGKSITICPIYPYGREKESNKLISEQKTPLKITLNHLYDDGTVDISVEKLDNIPVPIQTQAK